MSDQATQCRAPGNHHVRLSLNGIAKSFGRRRVLRSVSLTAETGNVLSVAGPNGSGKSTLLKLIAGLLMPDAGAISIVVGGEEAKGRQCRQTMGWVSPDMGLYSALTGDETIRFFAALRGVRIDAQERLRLLDRFGLARRRNDRVGEYSSGMRQRLRLASAVVHDPKVLLLDEPFVTLDADGVKLASELVREQRGRGITVVAGNDARELALGDVTVHLGSA